MRSPRRWGGRLWPAVAAAFLLLASPLPAGAFSLGGLIRRVEEGFNEGARRGNDRCGPLCGLIGGLIGAGRGLLDGFNDEIHSRPRDGGGSHPDRRGGGSQPERPGPQGPSRTAGESAGEEASSGSGAEGSVSPPEAPSARSGSGDAPPQGGESAQAAGGEPPAEPPAEPVAPDGLAFLRPDPPSLEKPSKAVAVPAPGSRPDGEFCNFAGRRPSEDGFDDNGPASALSGLPREPESMSGEVSVPAMIAGSSPKKAGQALRQAASRLKLGDARGAIAGAERAGASGDAGPGLFLLEAEAFSRAASRPGLSARERRGLFVRAEAAALKAVREDPLGAKGFKWLAWSRLSLGRYRDAVKSAGESIRLDPRDPEAHAIRAYAYERLGDRGRMLADIEEAARLDAGRFFGQALRARRNEALFDPAAEDSLQLLEGALRPGARRGLPWPAWFLLLAGGAGAVAGLLRRLRRRVQPKAGGRDQEAPEPEPGLGLLSGKYRLRRVIGKGGMGQVWEAHDEVLDRDVAIKKMALSGGELETQGRALFIEEARTLASLHHPGIVEIYEVLDLPSGIFLVFELLSGKTVAQIIAERGRLPVAAARGILRQACAALGFAHRSGVVHRDLKASNLMVTDQGFVKVVDFGIARRLSDSSPGEGALPPSAAGTPAAMAPEAASGLCSAACDVFSLGVCFYEMLTGRLPFPPDSLPGPGRKYVPALSLVPGLPPAVDAFIARALEPDPGKRLRTAEEFLAAMNSDVP